MVGTTVPKTLSAPFCLCIRGDVATREGWLDDVLSRLPAGTPHLLAPASSASPPTLSFAGARIDAATRDLLADVARGHPNHHAVLLEAGAYVPPHAFERLLAVFATDDIGSAGGLDDVDPARSPLPPGATTEASAERIDRLCHAFSSRTYADAASPSPLASSWHALALASLIGDEESTRRWRHVIVDGVYVARGTSPLRGPALGTDPRDPLPPSPLAPLREAVARALEGVLSPGYAGLDGRPVLLHVLHGWGGGAERWVRDLCASFDGVHHRVLVARGSHARRRHGEWLELLDGSFEGPPLRRVALPDAIADTAIEHGGYAAIVREWVDDARVDAVVVSSLIGHALDVLRTGLPTVRVIHDHYPLWPVLHRDFGDTSLAFDDAQRVADLTALGADREFANNDPAHWKALRDATANTLRDIHATLVAPSRSALADDLRLAPELALLPAHVIGHGLDGWPAGTVRVSAPPSRDRLRLVVPGRVRRGKGAALLEQALPGLLEHADVFLLGAGGDAHAFFGRSGVHVVLDYRRDRLPDLLATLAPDAALLLPTVSETFGYTLSELRTLGVPVVATRIGALAERIRDGVDGFLADVDADAIVACIAGLAADRARLDVVRTSLATFQERDLAAMAADYAALGVWRDDAPRIATPGLCLTLRLELAEAVTAHRRALEHGDALERDLAGARAESARRGAWGHALDRDLAGARTRIDALGEDLETRTQWALGLDAEVAAQRERIGVLEAVARERDAMLVSRSWRVTVPLRAATTFLRRVRASLRFRAGRALGLARRVRGSLARHGLAGTWQRILRELRGGTPAPRTARTYDAPSEAFEPFTVPGSATPRVSIVIPVHNKFAYTAACLRSLAEHASETPFEVIVVDDASTDATWDNLARIDGIRPVRNAANLGFVGSCNAGAAAARGDYVLFLNNDTVVTPEWLDALLRCFDEEPDAGLVGSQLVYPDGRLQEAGGIVFDDASGWNVGRFGDPDDAAYQYRREADYCSGAAILLRRALFETLGGFDMRYAPAYYEDTDLAFAVRAHGLKVFYEPASRVIHFEGITAGTDTGSGMKRFQVVNQAKFLDKWREALRDQPSPGTPIPVASTHRARKRVLIIDATTPAPDQDSGSLRMVNLMRVLRANGVHVTFMADNRAWVERYTRDLQELGIEVLYHPYVSDPVRWFRERGAALDAIILSRHYVAANYVGIARLHAPQARLVFDTVDLHYLREQRAAELEGKPDLARQAAVTRVQELKLMRECDVTLVVSPVEQAILAVDAPGAAVDVLSNVHEVYGRRAPFASRRDLVFVGGFQHPPNTDAVTWFVAEVMPLLRAADSGLRFHVIGSKVPDAIRALAADDVIVHGFVEDIAPFMDGCRLSVAPLRYGAGVKGKVNMAMSYGLPVVATPMAVEGMHVRAGEDVVVAETPRAYADAILALDRDEALWTRLSDNGLANVHEHFSFEAAEKAIRRIVGF